MTEFVAIHLYEHEPIYNAGEVIPWAGLSQHVKDQYLKRTEVAIKAILSIALK